MSILNGEFMGGLFNTPKAAAGEAAYEWLTAGGANSPRAAVSFWADGAESNAAEMLAEDWFGDIADAAEIAELVAAVWAEVGRRLRREL